MDRREFVRMGVAAGVTATTTKALGADKAAKTAPGGILEAGVREQQQQMAAGKLTSHALTSQYLARIRNIDKAGPRINAVIEINPEALKLALEMDRERTAGRVRGPLHGIPVLLKDNIATGDRMSTTAGSLALAGVRAKRDAHVAAQLRAAGAIIIGKTNLSEWANMRSTHSISGWSARGGLTRNPYALDRNCSGSSSGSGAAIAAGLATLAVGTETDGSIVSPASICGVVGIKPTLGLVSRSGIIPIAHSQDTAGPMARTVADAALLLAALAGVDPRDPATRDSGATRIDYTAALQPGGLQGKRLGVARNFFGYHADLDAVIAKALEALKAQGAILVDVEVPNSDKYGDSETEVLLYEFKADLEAYLKECTARAGVEHGRRHRLQPRACQRRATVLRPGIPGTGASQGRPGDAGLPRSAGQQRPLRARRRHRPGNAGAPARRTGGAHRRPRMAHRLYQWRPFWRQLLVAGSGGGLPAYHGAGRAGAWLAGGAVVRGRRVQRTGADPHGVFVRTGHAAPARAAVQGHRLAGGTLVLVSGAAGGARSARCGAGVVRG